MFKKLTKLLVSQVDPNQELVPVESIGDDKHFRPLYLLRSKNKPNTTFHSAPFYQEAGFKLDDVLLPGKHVPLHEDSRPFTITTDTTENIEGGITIPLDAVSIGVEGGGSASYTLSITAQQKGISLESLEEVRRERKINMDHHFIQQLQRTGSNLFVVTEILEAAKEGVFKESIKEELSIWEKIFDLIRGKGSREKTQCIT
ncbi:gasdermin-A-like, partial [Malurus melanocephalus]|uniref:gasdermin-A-like n=1 Tax=Malurus melanocephalus TaxID=175006 RepID=UPI0025480565